MPTLSHYPSYVAIRRSNGALDFSPAELDRGVGWFRTLQDKRVYSQSASDGYLCQMHKLLYVSSTKKEFPTEELADLLRMARINNDRLGVTGLLLYIDGGFLQVLEGERTVLHDLYGAISQDPRHWDAKLLVDQASPRNFGNWSMGFKLIGEETNYAGVVGITQAAINGLIKPGGAQPILDVLIRTFRTVQGAP